jgi:hypothetical protein
MRPFSEIECRGPWTRDDVATFLDDVLIPMRIAVNSSSGCPIVLSVWFLRDGNSLIGATRPTSTLIRCLMKSPECGFEIGPDTPPYRGVRGKAIATLEPTRGGQVLDQLLIKYQGSLDSPLAVRLRKHAADEVCFRLDPTLLITWDYAKRMASPQAKNVS